MLRGQKFELNLDDEDQQHSQTAAPLPGAFVGDVLERRSSITAAPPKAPTLKSKTGFPEHRKRHVESRFKKQNASNQDQNQTEPEVTPSILLSKPDDETLSATASSGKPKTWEENERERIDLENRQKLAQMSPDEIEAERQELMNSLSPGLLQRLLQRSNINSGSGETDLSNHMPTVQTDRRKPKKENTKTVSFVEPELPESDSSKTERDYLDNDDLETPIAEDTLPQVHFPRPPQPPDLDPSSETFLQDLHDKYFPQLPSNPDQLEWMQPPASTAKDTYSPSATALSPKDLRFSFKGELIPPKTANEIPVTAGLHHHGDAPEAAGYTIAELAHLAHSSFAPQRCIAFQTLGRILYRLGKGEFGDTGEAGAETVGAEETFGELARGLWAEMEREQVVQTLIGESEGKGVDGGRHVSARAYATEAVWLWRKGGGRTWKAG